MDAWLGGDGRLLIAKVMGKWVKSARNGDICYNMVPLNNMKKLYSKKRFQDLEVNQILLVGFVSDI